MTDTEDSTANKPSQSGLNKDLREMLTSPEAQPPGLAQRIEDSPTAAFLPWAIYWLIANSPSTWFYGALAALLVALIFAAPGIAGRRIKVFDAVTIVFFVGLVIAGIVMKAQDRDWMDTYSTIIASAALAVFAIASLAFKPLTEDYARQFVVPSEWSDPGFKRMNQVLTLTWGLVFAAIAILEVIADRYPSTSSLTNWVIPIALFVFAARFTQLYPARARQRS